MELKSRFNSIFKRGGGGVEISRGGGGKGGGGDNWTVSVLGRGGNRISIPDRKFSPRSKISTPR